MSKINPEYLCPGCMAVLDEPDLPCPLCGFDKKTYSPSPRSLRPFTKLNIFLLSWLHVILHKEILLQYFQERLMIYIVTVLRNI